MTFSFIKNLVGVKADRAVNSAVEALVRWDPQAATEAELRTMEQHLDELGIQVAKAQQDFDREWKEFDAIHTLQVQRMTAAESLQTQLNGATDPAQRASLETSLGTLVGMLEQMASDVDREKQDVDSAQEFLTSLKQTYEEAGKKLRSARADLDRAQRNMARAGQQREVAERRADAARQAAGLAGNTSSLNVALKAMQDSAAADQAKAGAALAKARMLTPTSPEKEDPNIAAALAAAQGKSPAPQTLSERLAALKAQTTAPAQAA